MKQQYTALTTAVHNKFKCHFQNNVAKQDDEVELDDFTWCFDGQQKLLRPVESCSIGLFLSHGSVFVESAFPVKSLLRENLHEETIVCLEFGKV